MAAPTSDLTQLHAWQALDAHYKSVRDMSLRTLFAQELDARRADGR